jgi:gliding motility-associated-like protein
MNIINLIRYGKFRAGIKPGSMSNLRVLDVLFLLPFIKIISLIRHLNKLTIHQFRSKNIDFSYNLSRIAAEHNFLKMKQFSVFKTIVFTVLSLFMLSDNVYATHVVGGNLSYKRLDGNRYEVILTFRRDCELGADDAQFDNPASIGIFSADNGFLLTNLGFNGQLLLPFRADDTLNQTIMSDCGFEGQQVCVHETTYRGIVTLPFREGGYILAYQRCCRNASLTNVEDPLETGATYWVTINAKAQLERNNSPEFVRWPTLYVCANEDLMFQHNAFDSDGDSLVYRLYNPKNGGTAERPKPQPPARPPYFNIDYRPPFGLDNLMGGEPFRIDPNTGVFTGRPNAVGQYLIGVAVDEYRNGELIGTVYRDFQYNVRVCSDPPTADFGVGDYNCDGLEVNFENQSIAVTRLEWNFNYPSTDPIWQSNEENPVFTFPEEGFYDVQLVAIRLSDNCRDEIVKTVSVFNSPVNADFDVSLAACLPDGSVQVILEDKSSIGIPGLDFTEWNWTVRQNGNEWTYVGNPVLIDLEVAEFEVSLNVVAENGCFGNVSRIVPESEISFAPSFKITVNECDEDNQNFSITIEDTTPDLFPTFNIIARRWLVTIGGVTTEYFGTSINLDLPESAFVVELELEADNGCSGSTLRELKVEDFFPITNFNITVGDCSPDNQLNITLTAMLPDSIEFVSIVSVEWIINNVTYTTENVELLVSLDDTLNVMLMVQLSNNCIASISREVIVRDLLPSLDIEYQAEECPDEDSVSLTFYWSSNDADTLVNRDKNWVFTFNQQIIEASGDSVLITVPKDSLIHIRLEVELENNCIISIEKSFVPGPFANINFLTEEISVCALESVQFVVNPNPNFTYIWSPEEGLDLSDPSNPIATVNETTTYYVTVSDGVCEVTDSVTIFIINDLDITVTGDLFTCDGSATLTASGGIGSGIYEWSEDIDFSVILDIGETITISFTESEKIIYVRFNGGDCASMPQEVIISNEQIQLEFASPFEICPGDTIQLPVINLVPGHIIEITWEPHPYIIDGNNVLTPTIGIPEDATEGAVLYFSAINQFGCELADSIIISLTDRPTIDFTYALEDCEGTNVCFTIQGNYFGFPQWTFGDPTNPQAGSFEPNPCYEYPEAGSYIVTLSNATNICAFDAVSKEITINDESLVMFDDREIIVCRGDTVTLTVPEDVLIYDYSWCDTDGNEISKEPEIIIVANQSQLVILKVVDQNDCPFTDTIFLDVFDINFNIDMPDVYCLQQNAMLFVNIENGENYLYEWFPEECIVDGGNTPNPTIFVEMAKDLRLVVTDPDSGCSVEIPISIEPLDFIIELDADPGIEIRLGNQVTIFVVDSDPQWTYVWNTGDSGIEITVEPSETTTYIVTVTDENGCTTTAAITITVTTPTCEEDVFLPNAFSPNGDGVNDILYVRGVFIDDVELVIYNRWGEQVFSTTDINIGWDGTFKGKELAPDAYAYWLRARCGDGAEVVRRGNVSLLR